MLIQTNENCVNLIDQKALRLNRLEAKYYANKTSLQKGSSDDSIVKFDNDNENWKNMDKKEFLEKKQMIWGSVLGS